VAGGLKRLHALPVPDDVPVGLLDPFVRLPERIRDAMTVPSDDRAWLRSPRRTSAKLGRHDPRPACLHRPR
jgi:hypothetical protein